MQNLGRQRYRVIRRRSCSRLLSAAKPAGPTLLHDVRPGHRRLCRLPASRARRCFHGILRLSGWRPSSPFRRLHSPRPAPDAISLKSPKAGITPTTEDVCRGKETTTEVGTMKKIVSAIVLAVTMTAMPALARSGLLEKNSLAEAVISSDAAGALPAAMIIKVQSDSIVDLEVTGDDG